MIILILIFNILLLNFIVAILSNTYNIFDNRSNGLYLSKILSTRDELNYDEYYGAFLSAMPPINLIQLPFIPLTVFFRYGDCQLKKMNNLLMKTQYTLFMMIFYSVFIVISLSFIPLAWIVGVFDKFQNQGPHTSMHNKILNFGVFIPFGIPILLLDTFADMYYFWKNNFRTNLQKIIIPREESTVSHKSLREIMSLSRHFHDRKIKSVFTGRLVRIFRRQFHVN